MKPNDYAKIQRINCLANDLDKLYHQAARMLGVSDSVMFILYMLYEKGDRCLLSDICAASGISKQTINSALRKHEREEILYLEQDKVRSKRVCLTEKSVGYMNKTAGRLYELESSALSGWNTEEFESYLKFMKKYNTCFAAELQKL